MRYKFDTYLKIQEIIIYYLAFIIVIFAKMSYVEINKYIIVFLIFIHV